MHVGATELWHQGWKTSNMLGFEDEVVIIQKNYLGELRKDHIRIRDEVDELGQSTNNIHGYHTTKIRCMALRDKGE